MHYFEVLFNVLLDFGVHNIFKCLAGSLSTLIVIAGTGVVSLETAKTVNTPGTLTVKNGASFGFGTATATASLSGTGTFVAKTGSTVVITFAAGISALG